MFRFIFICLWVISFLIFSTPLLLAEWIIGKYNPGLKDRTSLAIVKWAFRGCLKISGAKIIVLGEENVPTDTPVLYVGNHRSYFDILLTYVRVPRPTGYVAKVEMLRYPSLRKWMKYLHCLFLDRKDIKAGLKTILEAVSKVQNGISICIFPEGTRSREKDAFLEFHNGSFKIAEKSGCPIIPMAICNSDGIFENQFPKIRKTCVVIEYLPPIYMSELDKEAKKKIGGYVCGQIKEAYFKNKALL